MNFFDLFTNSEIPLTTGAISPNTDIIPTALVAVGDFPNESP